MYKIFDTLADYNQYTDNGTRLTAGKLYLVKENKSLYFQTNNIDGETEKYEYLDEIPEGYIIPTGNIAITENGENIDVNNYATASVNVTPNLTTQNITQNGTYQPSGNYDGFSSVTVAVPQPTGNISITENGENIDIAQYATASVNVPIPEGYIIPTGNIAITQNGTNIDVNDYATATVAVPQPSGNISITENGENIDIAQYATATVNVAGSGGNEDLIDLIERDLTSINIPSGTTKIGKYAFYYYNSLTSVTIPNGVTNIGEYAFNNCRGLTSVTIPDSVTSIGSEAFSACTGLTSVTIGSGVTNIGNQTFRACTGLTSVTIPDSVTSIGSEAFGKCSGLTSVTIGSGVTSFLNYVFSGCSVLTSVTIEATTPPSLGAGVFNNANNCTIYVPAESVEAYKTATNWSTYADRIQAIPTE